MSRFSASAAGWLSFDPEAKSIVKKPWWVILQCDRDWFYLYKDYLEKHGPTRWANVVDLDRRTGHIIDRTPRLGVLTDFKVPAWGPHISVIRGEQPPEEHQARWGEGGGRKVDFLYDPDLQFAHDYYWLDVQCPELLDLRESFGLPRDPLVKLHLTVGRI